MASRWLPARWRPLIAAVTGRRIAIVAGIAVAVVLLRSLESVDSTWFPRCPLAEWTGLLCPGCGSTRALHALAHGNVAAAIAFNPLLVLGGPPLLLWLAWRRRCGKLPTSATLPTILVIVFVVYFIARNLPGPAQRWSPPPRFSPSTFDGGPVDIERNEPQ